MAIAKPKKAAGKKLVAKSAPKSVVAGHNPLTTSAMLVCLEVHTWGNRVVEREMANKAASDVNATDKNMFFLTKKLVDRDTIRDVTTAFSRVKSFHYEHTLPWLDNGQRVVPSLEYMHYTANIRTLIQEADAKVDEFLKVYPIIRAKMVQRLGKAFHDDDYPTPAALRRRWSVDVNFSPMPDKADFRVDLPAKELATINQNIDDQVARAVESAQNDLFQRLYSVVLSMRDRIKDFKVVEGKGGKRKVENAFRNSAVENVRELCKMLPRLNFTNNPDLTRLAEEVAATLGNQDAETLREDDTLRAKAVEAADDVLKRMAAYIGDAT